MRQRGWDGMVGDGMVGGGGGAEPRELRRTHCRQPEGEKGAGERKTTLRGREREREDTELELETLFYKDCSLDSVKILSNS